MTVQCSSTTPFDPAFALPGDLEKGISPDYNEALAANINDLIKRVCALEDKAVKHEEIMKTLANELNGFKRELDRLRLSDKLNSGAIERLDKALDLINKGE